MTIEQDSKIWMTLVDTEVGSPIQNKWESKFYPLANGNITKDMGKSIWRSCDPNNMIQGYPTYDEAFDSLENVLEFSIKECKCKYSPVGYVYVIENNTQTGEYMPVIDVYLNEEDTKKEETKKQRKVNRRDFLEGFAKLLKTHGIHEIYTFSDALTFKGDAWSVSIEDYDNTLPLSQVETALEEATRLVELKD